MTKILIVFIGGGMGSVLRYLISLGAANWSNHCAYPVGTLICNIFGCFLIGLFGSYSARFGWSPELRLMLTVGLCGGFTTFSTLSNEGLSMLSAGNYLTYTTYMLISILLGIAAVFIGTRI